jgi:signal transduction histidine kinase
MDQPKGKRRPKANREKVFSAAIDSIPHGTLIVAPGPEDGQETVVLASKRLSDICWIAPDKLLGKDPWVFWDDLLAKVEHPASVREDLVRISRSRTEVRTDVLRFVRPQILPVERFTVPLLDSDGAYLGRLWTFRNANREFAIREDLHRERRLELFLRNLAGAVIGDTASPDAMAALCRIFCLGLDVASVTFFPAPGNRLAPAAQFTVSRKHELKDPQREVLSCFAQQELALAAGLGVQDVESNALPDLVVAAMAQRFIVRLVLVPVIGGGHRHGILVLEENDPDREWSLDDTKSALAGAQLVSSWLVRLDGARLLEEARGQVEAAGRARSDFIALLSHELRTPLNPLIGFTQIMEEARSELRPEFHDMVSRIGSGARRLRDLIEDLLTLTRLDARLDGWRRYHCDPRSIAEDCAAWAREIAQERRVTVVVDAGSGLGVVEADGAALRRAINAMLSNAVRFSPEGATVRLEMTPSPDSLLVRVVDSGPGVPDDLKKKIFEPFVQGEPVLTRRFGGIGIGLTLVKMVANSHSGDAWVDDAPGGGAVFNLRVPRGFAAGD